MRIAYPHLFGSIVLIALLGLSWAQWRADRAAAPGTLLAIAPQQIDRIKIERHGQPPQKYRRHDGHWWTVPPDTRRADDGRLGDIAAIAGAPVQRWLLAKGRDLHKLGLAPAQLTLQLNDKRLDYGAITPFAPNRYVRAGDRIAVIAAQYTPRVAAPHAVNP